MPLTLDRATTDDAPAIARIWALAFADPFNSVRYGTLTLDDKVILFTRRVLEAVKDKQAPWFVMRDTDANGKVAAFAKWRYPKHGEPKALDQEKELNDDEKAAKRRAEEERWRNQFSPFSEKMNIPLIAESSEMWARLRKTTLKGRPAFALEALATDPEYRRRGAATALVQIPFQQADEEGHLIYLDTFEGGYQEDMYRKFDFQEQLRDGVPDMERFGKVVPSGFKSFLRFPKSK